MFVRLFIFTVVCINVLVSPGFLRHCLFVTTRTEDECQTLEHHKNFHLLPSEDVCGRVKVNQMFSSRILNGITAKEGSFPWMVHILIRSDGKWSVCGGSVINKNYILTAAHCFDNKNNPSVFVNLGVHNRKLLYNGLVERYNMSGYILHPEYDERTSKNDIALICLDRSISFESRYINSICLPTSCELAKNTYLGDKLTMAGWGHLSNGSFATTLQRVDVPVKQCPQYKMYSKYNTPSQEQLCAGSSDVIACGGDSGGPLAHKTAERFVQVGVLSFGPTDCQKSSRDQADFYTRVASFMRWILDNIDN